MTDKELYNIVGGAGMSAALLNALIRGLNSILELGRSVGTAFRRIRNGSSCEL